MLLMILLQRSIEDKLENLKREKHIIKEEIDRLKPELQKVMMDHNYVSHLLYCAGPANTTFDPACR